MRIFLKIFCISFLLVSNVFAVTPEEEGRIIAEKSDAVIRGFGSEIQKSRMVLINAHGDEVVRETIAITLERKNKMDYSIIQFLNPPDVMGTGLLTYQNPKGDDKQWLYLPDLRRVKKISSKNKSGSFMGSEFAYEDITGNTLDKFTYKKIGEETYKSTLCFIVEKYPTYKNSGYTKIKMWIAKDTYLPIRYEFTDRKHSLLKVQYFEGWQKYDKGFYRFKKIIMENLQTKKKSILIVDDRKVGIGLKDKDFSKRSLQRLIKF